MTEVSLSPRSSQDDDRWLRLPRCRACGRLMRGVVACCPNSHATCCSAGGRCATCSEPLLPPSAYTVNLQRLAAANPAVQCAHSGLGCPEHGPLSHMAEHERACAHRPLTCRVAPDTCGWRVPRHELEGHTLAAHPQSFVRFPGAAGARVSWRVSKQGCCVDLTRHIVVALGETFVYQKEFNYDEKQLYVAVQLVGPLEQSRRYRYKFKLTSNEIIHSATFEHVVHAEDEDLRRACCLGDCIKVPYDTIAQFCHGERLLVLCKAREPDVLPGVEV